MSVFGFFKEGLTHRQAPFLSSAIHLQQGLTDLTDLR